MSFCSADVPGGTTVTVSGTLVSVTVPWFWTLTRNTSPGPAVTLTSLLGTSLATCLPFWSFSTTLTSDTPWMPVSLREACIRSMALLMRAASSSVALLAGSIAGTVTPPPTSFCTVTCAGA